MSLFGPSKTSYLGVDFGSGGLKLVELVNEKGRARLHTYAFVEKAPSEMQSNYLDNPQETAELLKSMMKKGGVSTKKAVSALPISSVFSSIISVQKTAKKEEMEEAIRWQAKKLIPLPLEEMTIDWKPITLAPKADDKYVEVLLTGAAKTLIAKYLAVFTAAGLELSSLETEALALIRSLIGRDKSATLLLDIGGLRTNILIVENGIPYLSRSVAIGGLSLTKEVANALAMSEDQAETMKIDTGAVTSLYAGGAFPKVFEKVLAPIVTELNYTANLFLGQKINEGKKIEKIILAGGGALLPNLSDYLSKAMNMRVYVGDPWARVVYPEALKGALASIGPRFGVSIGLAMRDIE
jgi:type IV pilus assembly protein PilM